MNWKSHNGRSSGLIHTLRNVLDFGEVWLARYVDRGPRHLPILVIMLTDKCNLKCKMCGACDYSPGDHNALSTSEWKAVLDSAAKIHVQILSITGGEAMLRKDLFELIAYARARGMAVHLNTNGLLLREKNVEKLRASGVETVSISLESTHADTHEAIRGRGTFAHTLDGLRLLRRRLPDVRIGLNCVINKHNYKTLASMVAFAAQEGVDQVKFAPIHTNLQHKDKAIGEYEDMLFEERDLDGLEAELQRIQTALAVTSLQSTSKRFFDGITNLYRPPASNFYCYAGYAITVINAQGFVSACFDKDSTLNVRETTLDQIWRSRAFQEHRQLVRHCDRACWDTTNAELSLRLSIWNTLREPVKLVKNISYYLTRRKAAPSPAKGIQDAQSG